MKIACIWFLLFLLAPAVADSASLRGVRLSTAPVVDGHPNDKAWSQAETVSGFVTTDNKPAAQDTTVKVGYTADGLYVLFLCDYEEKKGLVTNV
ncbi:MAG: hypothetical protein JXA11_00325, partial [Phycisphaerae bacterium]|nr:hypothetical protein [Phycisphaerae bacterium]